MRKSALRRREATSSILARRRPQRSPSPTRTLGAYDCSYNFNNAASGYWFDSARRFILAWRKIKRFEEDIFQYMSLEDARSVVDAIAEAEDILWADMELAKL